jgi:hypothetical protein
MTDDEHDHQPGDGQARLICGSIEGPISIHGPWQWLTAH